MNRQKAPKNMSVDEFIDLVEKRYYTEEPTNMNAWINTLRMIAEEPAPNPFTADQLAWMREAQRDGYAYSAMNKSSNVLVYAEKPYKQDDYWVNADNRQNYNAPRFFKQYTSWYDPEPLCFADYAPLMKDEVDNAT